MTCKENPERKVKKGMAEKTKTKKADLQEETLMEEAVMEEAAPETPDEEELVETDVLEEIMTEEDEEQLEELDRKEAEEILEQKSIDDEPEEQEEVADELDTIITEEATGQRRRRQYRRVEEVVDNTIALMERSDKNKEMRKTWEKLDNAQKRGTILSAQVVEVGRSADGSGISITARIDDNFKVLIRDREFFMDNAFRSDYYTASEEEQTVRRMERARACIGAWIPFIIMGKSSEYDRETREMIYTIVGNRVAAMNAKQEYYFKGERPVEAGFITTAEVISVGEMWCTLEVLGVECSIPVNEIDAFHYIHDCRDALAPGDQLKVEVRRIHRRDDGSIRLNVSGSAVGYREIAKNTQKLKVGDVRMGVIKNYNNTSGIYTVITDDHAAVAVRSSQVVGRDVIVLGDTVIVVVNRKTPNMAFGTAKRK